MSLSPQTAPGKPKQPTHYRPNPQEGLHIQYRLHAVGKKPIEIPTKMGLHHSSVYNVISGRRRSARIEAEIARILGKADWNEVVLEARSEVQKKPVEEILREREQRLHEQEKEQNANRGDGMARRAEEMVFLDGEAAAKEWEKVKQKRRTA